MHVSYISYIGTLCTGIVVLKLKPYGFRDCTCHVPLTTEYGATLKVVREPSTSRVLEY